MAMTVDFTTVVRTMNGFGASSAFAIPYSTAVADFLFRSDTGIGLSWLREHITPNGYPISFTSDGNPAPGSPYVMWSGGSPADDQTYAVAIQAWNRGARVWGTFWDLPLAWQNNNAHGALLPAHYGDAAALAVSYVDRAWTLGVPIWHIGVCNEPDITPSYNQTAWTTSTLATYVKNNLAPSLASWGQSHLDYRRVTGQSQPGIMLPQTSVWSALSTWINSVEGDSTYLGDVSLYGTHAYPSGGVSSPPSPTSRPIWETEVFDLNGSYDVSMTQGLTIAGYVHNAITTGTATNWHYWFAEDVSDNNNSGLVGTNAVNWTNQSASLADWNAPTFGKRAYCLGNFAKWVRPGWQQVTVSGAPAGVNVTAYMDPTGQACAIVAINTNASSTALTVNLTGISVSTVTPWVTDASNNLASKADIAVTSGTFSATLNATSVTTFVSPPAPIVAPVLQRISSSVWA